MRNWMENRKIRYEENQLKKAMKYSCILFFLFNISLLFAQNVEPVLTGYSDLLKVADYDYTDDNLIRASGRACNDLRDGKPEEAIRHMEELGYDFIHNYPMVACEDDPNHGVMFYHLWRNDGTFKKFFELVLYVKKRSDEDFGTKGTMECLYCTEIFNLLNMRGQTLLDLLNGSRSRSINAGLDTTEIDKVIQWVIKLGGKTSDEILAD